VGPREVEVFSQEVHQEQAWLYLHTVGGPIHGECDGDLVLGFD
jgi:hypothetical protein